MSFKPQVLTVADGGTDASTASQARTNLGVAIGVDVQAFDSDLSAIAGLASNGVIARTGSGTASVRSLTGTTNFVDITNGDGVSGNPTISSRFGTIRVNKTFADFAVAALTGTSTLITMPARTKVLLTGIGINTIPDSVATLNFEIGISGTPDLYLGVTDGAVVSGNEVPFQTNEASLRIATYDIITTATATGANLNTMTQGSWDFYISYLLFT